MLTEKHNYEKLAITRLIVGIGWLLFIFGRKINDIIIINSRWYRGECIRFSDTSFAFSVLTDHDGEESKDMI